MAGMVALRPEETGEGELGPDCMRPASHPHREPCPAGAYRARTLVGGPAAIRVGDHLPHTSRGIGGDYVSVRDQELPTFGLASVGPVGGRSPSRISPIWRTASAVLTTALASMAILRPKTALGSLV